uniref:Uncharacterized protein n=1 Tax=Arundo donax TaxID=35708 RepID=A0A0A9SCI0_ARUDO
MSRLLRRRAKRRWPSAISIPSLVTLRRGHTPWISRPLDCLPWTWPFWPSLSQRCGS